MSKPMVVTLPFVFYYCSNFWPLCRMQVLQHFDISSPQSPADPPSITPFPWPVWLSRNFPFSFSRPLRGRDDAGTSRSGGVLSLHVLPSGPAWPMCPSPMRRTSVCFSGPRHLSPFMCDQTTGMWVVGGSTFRWPSSPQCPAGFGGDFPGY